MKFHPHPYQREAIEFLTDKQQAALLLDPGAGKTAISLQHIHDHQYKTLVVAPLRVIYGVWRQEAAKWDQFNGLTFALVHGSPKARLAALQEDADVHLINPEALPWLLEQDLPEWDCLIVDESTKFKNWGAKRTKAIRKLVPQFDSRVILTGTPTPNTIADLFPQMFIADGGETLGKAITRFRMKYFVRGGFKGYEWILRGGATEQIEKAVAPRTYRIDMNDHLDLPELLTNDIWVDMPDKIRKQYRKLEQKMLLELPESRLVASNAGAKYLMCRQMANGFVYNKDKSFEDLHSIKLEVVESLIEELQGKPVIIAYQFDADYVRLCAFLKRKVHRICGKTSGKETDELCRKWNEGRIDILAVQPQALSHGMNMQGAGNDIIWLGLTDSLETYLQLNARLHRQGIQGSVRIHRILLEKTVDTLCHRRLESKDGTQKSLLNSLKEYRNAITEG